MKTIRIDEILNVPLLKNELPISEQNRLLNGQTLKDVKRFEEKLKRKFPEISFSGRGHQKKITYNPNWQPIVQLYNSKNSPLIHLLLVNFFKHHKKNKVSGRKMSWENFANAQILNALPIPFKDFANYEGQLIKDKRVKKGKLNTDKFNLITTIDFEMINELLIDYVSHNIMDQFFKQATRISGGIFEKTWMVRKENEKWKVASQKETKLLEQNSAYKEANFKNIVRQLGYNDVIYDYKISKMKKNKIENWLSQNEKIKQKDIDILLTESFRNHIIRIDERTSKKINSKVMRSSPRNFKELKELRVQQGSFVRIADAYINLRLLECHQKLKR